MSDCLECFNLIMTGLLDLLASVVLVPLDRFSLALVLVFGFEIILVSFSSSTASL